MGEKSAAVIQLLNDKTLDKQTRDQKIIDVVMPIVNFPLLVKLAIGKKHWYKIDKVKRDYLVDLLLKKLQRFYLNKLDLYFTNETIEVKGAEYRDNRIYVITDLVTARGRIEITFKFFKSDRDWKAYDVELLGISVVRLYRGQFSAILRYGTVDDLIEKIKVSYND